MSKTQTLVDLAFRKQGVTEQELIDSTGWIAARGALGSAIKRRGLKLKIDKSQTPTRYYAIK